MSLSSSVLDFFLGSSSVMSFLRSSALSSIRSFEKSEKHLLPFLQALVSLDNLRLKTRPPAHNCLGFLYTLQGHKSLCFSLIQFYP